MSFRRMRHVLLIALIATSSLTLHPALARAADPLTGAWNMVKYEGPATHGATTGLLLFTGTHFSLIYSMDEGDQRWARSHAGTYEVKGGDITYHVGWSVEYVSGKPSVAKKAMSRTAHFTLSGDTLTVKFDNGSVQTFERAK